MVLRMTNFNILGVLWEIQHLREGGGFTKNQYIWGDCLKMGGAWTVCLFKGAWQERGGECFWGGLRP